MVAMSENAGAPASSPAPHPAPAAPPTDPATAFLTTLLPAGQAVRKRAFSALLRAMLVERRTN